MRELRAVLLDFGGTLAADGRPSTTRFLAAYHAMGGKRDPIAFERLYRDMDQAILAERGTRLLGFRAMIARQAEWIRELAREPVDARAIAAQVYRDAVATTERNRPMLHGLARRHRLAVVSNFCG